MLRLRFPGAALVLALATAAVPVCAQTPAPAAARPALAASHLQAAREVVVVSGISGSFEGLYPEFRARMRQSLTATRPELKTDLETAIDSIKGVADKAVEDMVMSSARSFADKMSEAELKDVAVFFNSPVGKRFNSVRPLVIDEIFNLLQPWSLQTSDALFTALRAEMKKKGHDI